MAVVIGTTVVRPTVEALKAWLGRHSGKSVTVETEDGDKYEFNGYNGLEAERLIEASKSGHSGQEPLVGD
ncbi:hypothetical protein FL583_26045 [Cryptosporangium phraense]|uniref:Uncharacterized protein n=1 Tax=Cryptosporangium phraense TaxID=2593070 RepID=A0A545AL62_9ACTN|nr:hypothetical protein FL583_26045 [Cryptosporangium phraense]